MICNGCEKDSKIIYVINRAKRHLCPACDAKRNPESDDNDTRNRNGGVADEQSGS